jgi:hypothetical protein
MALQPQAAQPVAALEVTDAALDAGSVAGSTLAGSAGAWLVASGELDLLVGEVGERVFGRAGMKPLSATISRGRIPTRSSSAAGFSPGLPGAWPAGRMKPRAPLRVFSVTSQICATYPNSVGLPSLPLRISRASGSASETSRSVIFSPRATIDLLCDLAAVRSDLLELVRRAQLRARPASTRRGPRSRGQTLRFAGLVCDQPPGLPVERDHLLFCMPGAPRERP